jgi:hypothetical protein
MHYCIGIVNVHPRSHLAAKKLNDKYYQQNTFLPQGDQTQRLVDFSLQTPSFFNWIVSQMSIEPSRVPNPQMIVNRYSGLHLMVFLWSLPNSNCGFPVESKRTAPAGMNPERTMNSLLFHLNNSQVKNLFGFQAMW